MRAVSYFLLVSVLLHTAVLAQQTNTVAAPVKPGAPIVDIGTLQYIPQGLMAGRQAGTTAIVPPSLRVQFKIKDKSVTKLDTAVIYLFDKNGKPTQTLTTIDPSGFLPVPTTGGTPRKPTGQFPNLIKELSDLRPGTPYNLIFPCPDKKEWKFALAVLGDAKLQSCVYKASQSNVDVGQLEFKEKPFTLKN